jgi:hypothetical protein
VRHVVRLPDGTLLSEIFARGSHKRDEAVGLRIDAEGCLTFPADGLAPSHTAEPRDTEGGDHTTSTTTIPTGRVSNARSAPEQTRTLSKHSDHAIN